VDGAAGMAPISQQGGTTIAQNPQPTHFPVMPAAAIATGCIRHILHLEEIRQFLLLAGVKQPHEKSTANRVLSIAKSRKEDAVKMQETRGFTPAPRHLLQIKIAFSHG
jgi:hypothetical protein